MINEAPQINSLGATTRAFELIASTPKKVLKIYNGKPVKAYGKAADLTGNSSWNSHVLVCLNSNKSPEVISGP